MSEPTITKIPRSKCPTFINITPGNSNATYALLGIGVTGYAIDYNPQTTTEKWIIHDNATTTHDGNQKQGTVSQKMYAGDPCFEYVNSLRDKFGSDVRTDVIDIDKYITSGTGTVSYGAKKSNVSIVITSYLGEDATIEYTIYYDGDPIDGTVTITDGVPSFSATVA